VGFPQRLLLEKPKLLSDLWNSSVDDRSPNSEAGFDKFRHRIHGNDKSFVSTGLSRCLAAFILNVETPRAKEWQAFIRLCLDDDSRLNDEDLPLSHNGYESHFPLCKKEFLSTQFRFCPVRVEQDKVSSYLGANAACYRPYIVRRQLGRGSYGTVHEVEFTAQQFLFEDTGSVNRQGQCYAVKHIRLVSANDREWHTANTLLKCVRKHTAIMQTLAAVRYPEYLSLFYHVATYDLEHFMAKEQPPSTFLTRRQMLSKMVDIADAISFLHNGLQLSQSGVKIQCYHLDLKPSNVLVVDGPDGSVLKLADFGISSVKQGNTENNLRSLFRVQSSMTLVDSAKNTWGRQNGADVCLAPEASEPSSAPYRGVNSAADVWSYCAMLSIFVAWVWNGCAGMEHFRNARWSYNGDVKTDQVFTKRESSDAGPEDCRFKRKEGVDRWFSSLAQPEESLQSKRENDELSLYQQLWSVMQDGLGPQPQRRPSMDNVHRTLNHMLKLGESFNKFLLFPQTVVTDRDRPGLQGGAHPKTIDQWRYVEREELQTRLLSFCERPCEHVRERCDWFLLYGRSGGGKSQACFDVCENGQIQYVKIHSPRASSLTSFPFQKAFRAPILAQS
jgi:serine/threonine protein kinase